MAITDMSGDCKKVIVAFGEILWDILPDCMRLGGAPFNFVCRINSLNDRGLMISRLGRDELGRQALETVRSLGPDVGLLQQDPIRPTGTVQVSFDDDHMPDYLIVPEVAYDHIELTDSLIDAVARADCLCFGTLVQRSGTTRHTLARLLEDSSGCLKVLDINLRKNCYCRETVDYSLGHADLLKLNDDEVKVLGGLLGLAADSPIAFSNEVMERYPIKHCLVTFGEHGALVVSRTGETVYEPGYRVKLEDSVGSGDAFTAGFVHKYLCGQSVRESCHFGNMLGAIVATQVGGTEPVSAEQIEQFERNATKRNMLPELERYLAV